MLGRTHMSIGAVGAVVASPLLLNTKWETFRQLLNGHWASIPHVIAIEATIVAATVAGSVIPDLDQVRIPVNSVTNLSTLELSCFSMAAFSSSHPSNLVTMDFSSLCRIPFLRDKRTRRG